jgi:putative colanic acid biosynthesis glycosyltransferase
MTKLSVVTVVKDDPDGLSETCQSVKKHVKIVYEHIIWISPSSLDTYDLSSIENDSCVEIFLENDEGIFDAMNKATDKTSGTFVLYLNAGDKFIGDLVTQPTAPALIKVWYPDFRGKYKEVRKRQSMRLGIPYCHQGLVFSNDNIKYVNQKFGSDYILFLEQFKEWPAVNFLSGAIHYRNDGTSTINRLTSDKMTAAIIRRNFGIFYAVVFILRSYVKIVIKKVYNFIN